MIPASSLGQLVFNYQLIVSSPSACQQSCQDSRLWSIGRRHGAAWGFPSTSHKTDFAPEATWWLGLPKSSEKHVGCLVCSMLGWFQWMSQTQVLVMKIKTLPTVTANGKLSCWWQPHLLITAFLGLGLTIQTARIKLHAGSVHPAGYPFHSGPQQQVLVRIQCKWIIYCDGQSKAQEDESWKFSWAELKRTLGVKSSSPDLYVAIVELLPLWFLPVLLCRFFFLLQVLIEMDAFRRKGLKLRFVAVIEQRVGQNWKESDWDAGFTSTTQRLVVTQILFLEDQWFVGCSRK